MGKKFKNIEGRRNFKETDFMKRKHKLDPKIEIPEFDDHLKNTNKLLKHQPSWDQVLNDENGNPYEIDMSQIREDAQEFIWKLGKRNKRGDEELKAITPKNFARKIYALEMVRKAEYIFWKKQRFFCPHCRTLFTHEQMWVNGIAMNFRNIWDVVEALQITWKAAKRMITRYKILGFFDRTRESSVWERVARSCGYQTPYDMFYHMKVSQHLPDPVIARLIGVSVQQAQTGILAYLKFRPPRTNMSQKAKDIIMEVLKTEEKAREVPGLKKIFKFLESNPKQLRHGFIKKKMKGKRNVTVSRVKAQKGEAPYDLIDE